MNYIEVLFTLTSNEDFHQDLLIAALGEAGFDTFEETETGFNAYIPSASFDQSIFDTTVAQYHNLFSISYQINEIAQKNWNEVWESNFAPITIKDQCYVRATFHDSRPEFPFEIVIDPKMAFGTGHHQTTALMMEFMLEETWNDKSVLDMGCGTGILAILASKLGAKTIVAIDYDPVCYESTMENSKLNNASYIAALCGSKEAIPDRKFDIILANINRNILLDQIDRYAEVLSDSGSLFLSGFYESDLPILLSEAKKHKLTYVTSNVLNNWMAAKFIKEK